MQVHHYANKMPHFRNAVITIGTFDGVHTGHLQILNQLKKQAEKAGGVSVIITFHPHPRKVVGGQQSEVRLLNSLEEKIALLDKSGIDHLVIIPFTEDFARQSAIDYVENFLIKQFNPYTIIIGYDHRFGRNREGNYQLLEALKDKYGYEIIEISEKVWNNVTISSTKIRQSLLNGNIGEANELLGYPYFLQGEVVEGKKLGRTIGYPTANIRLNDEEKLVPSNGVYAVKACIVSKMEDEKHSDKSFKPDLVGMMNIGVRPTVQGTHRTIEVNLFNFDREIYGETIRVYFFKRLRGEVKFESLDALKTQLAKDKKEVENLESC